MRREYSQNKKPQLLQQGLPLHAQGIRKIIMTLNSENGITPACAGNTIGVHKLISRNEDYPCMRREY